MQVKTTIKRGYIRHFHSQFATGYLGFYQLPLSLTLFLLNLFRVKLTTDLMNNNTRVYKMSFASVYPHYIAKAEKKGRTQNELEEIIFWLTGYDKQALQQIIDNKTDFETFFAQAPQLNPNVSKITGVICGYRIEEIEDPLMKKIRYLDKLIDELAKGKAMEKILRK